MVYLKDNTVKPFQIAEDIQSLKGVVALWCNLTLTLTLARTLQPEQSARVGSISSRAPPLERHDKGSRSEG